MTVEPFEKPVTPSADEQTTQESAPTTPEEALIAALHKIAALEDEVKNEKDRALRAIAEMENTRRRLEKDKEDGAKFATTRFARELLSVADNLRRALSAIPEDARAQNDVLKNIYDGVAATEREMLRVFANAGIQKIEPLGELFNPNFHEVMFEAEIPQKMAGTIIQVLEAGYTIHERLLRPAKVGVAKGDPNLSVGNAIDQSI
jgi:molecular chaperone GrpE